MRAAVLELAFRDLGARRAESGWLEENAASARVSEKLGYREVGRRELGPRGTPVVEHQMEMLREEWRCPTAVAVSGLEPCLPLFGAAEPR
jgi:RimJ/RimL family protein N-acetyltransferase